MGFSDIRRFGLAFGLASWSIVLAAARGQTGLAGARAEWEEFLRTAKIGEAVQLGGPEAVTRPWKLALSKGDIRRYGLWKDIDLGENEGGPDRWRYEVSAYGLDALLGLEMVPPVVERAFQGRWGSLQLWIEDVESLKSRMESGVDIPEVQRLEFDRRTYLQRCFDSLIANEDRNVNNILLGADGRMILIDHSRSFRSLEPFAKTLVFGASGLRRTREGSPYPFLELPRAFVANLRALDEKSVKSAVRGNLTGREVRALLGRRGLILKEVEDLVRERGETNVLY
jgi:hypothetical protein